MSETAGPQSSQTLSPQSGSSGDAESGTEATTRLLLLWQVLREEFETHRPSGEKDEKVSSPPAEDAAIDLLQVRQPWLSKDALDAPRAAAKLAAERAAKVAAEERAGGDAAAAAKIYINDKTVSGFFRLLARSQKEAAEDTFNTLHDRYKRRCEKLPDLSSIIHGFVPGDGRLDERLAAEEISGTLDDFRARLEKESLRQKPTGEGGPQQDQLSDTTGRRKRHKRANLTDGELLRFVNSLLTDDREKRPRPSGGGDSAEPEAAGNGRPPADDGDDDGGDPAREAEQARARSLRSALCLSGGGIRSATFNLGILQGLARHGLLEQFDYLSTVSGGGFIGGWLTAWIHRDGTRTVIEELSHAPRSPLTPSPKPVDHLRVYSNYLSPRVGLLNADTWALGATLLRNLLLTWLVFVPFIVVALLLPRVWVAILTAGDKHGLSFVGAGYKTEIKFSLVLAVVAGCVAFIYAGRSLSEQPDPAQGKRPASPPDPSDSAQVEDPVKPQDSKFIIRCLLPGVVSAAALSAYWVGKSPKGVAWGWFVGFSILLALVAWIVTIRFRLTQNTGPKQKGEGRKLTYRLLFASLLILVAQGIAGLLLWAVATRLFPNPWASTESMILYATFSVPAALGVLLVGCALIAGFTSSLTADRDLEWWSRAGAWFVIVTIVWVAAHALVLYGPSIVLGFGNALSKLRSGKWDLKTLGQVLTVVGGGVSGIISLVGGFSGKTPAHGEETQRAGAGGRLLGFLTGLLAPVFLAFLAILIALGTNWLLLAGCLPLPDFLCYTPTEVGRLDPLNHSQFAVNTRLPLLVITGVLAAAAGTLMGMLINTNRFSLHYMWRNRIIRAYLGASKRKRRPHPFTGFDSEDNLFMSQLRPQPDGVTLPEDLRPNAGLTNEAAAVDLADKEVADDRRKLFHVLNIALNLAGGEKLAWQDRKSESFTVSPLHAGSYWLGYRRSLAYGGSQEGGISLGTSVAISGAFVSPNMGYMMTSPVVRFLMTLFNVRFGWWLGNPGPAGDSDSRAGRALAAVGRKLGYKSGKPFESRSPLLSVRPIVDEALGRTDDQHPYVYLSDGGHFENLGLYEMVLRRCRFIVVSDASTDAAYSFDSLAQSIRQIRVDLGVPIEMRDMSITPPTQGLMGKYCAVGKIRYSCVDQRKDDGMKSGDYDGTLIYIKASMVGEEPRDVINYGRGSKNFPQEVIVDQWFSEAQFESYRALGSHIIDAICSGDEREIEDQNELSLAAFERKAREHNRLNFRAFKGRIDYSALASQFRRTLQAEGSTRYKRRVRRFMKELIG